MSNEIMQIAEMFLELKAKAARGMTWTKDEQAVVTMCFEKEGVARVLAACCVLSSGRPKGCIRSLGIVREAIEQEHPAPFVELIIYEALTSVETSQLQAFSGAIVRFVEQSLKKRAISLDNTIFLLGKLARVGEVAALVLLRSLAGDSESGVRNAAGVVLRGLP